MFIYMYLLFYIRVHVVYIVKLCHSGGLDSINGCGVASTLSKS